MIAIKLHQKLTESFYSNSQLDLTEVYQVVNHGEAVERGVRNIGIHPGPAKPGSDEKLFMVLGGVEVRKVNSI